MLNFDTSVDIEPPQDMVYHWMFNFTDRISHLNPRVGHPEFMFEKRRKLPRRDITIFIYACGQNLTTINENNLDSLFHRQRMKYETVSGK